MFGGILSLMEELKVKNVIISKQFEDSDNFQRFKEIVQIKNIKVIVVKQGERLNIEKNISFDILWPNEKNLISENSLNNNSLVCKLNYKSFSMLFTGDIEEIAEKELLRQYTNQSNKKSSVLKSKVLKVGHHGSKTSSSQDFLEAVNPEIALIGVGENNKFGHPNSDVLKRIENIRSKNI